MYDIFKKNYLMEIIVNEYEDIFKYELNVKEIPSIFIYNKILNEVDELNKYVSVFATNIDIFDVYNIRRKINCIYKNNNIDNVIIINISRIKDSNNYVFVKSFIKELSWSLRYYWQYIHGMVNKNICNDESVDEDRIENKLLTRDRNKFSNEFIIKYKFDLFIKNIQYR